MANSGGIVRYMEISENFGFLAFDNGAATLWNSAQSVSSSQLILRSMWVSFATKSLTERLQISCFTDDTTGLVRAMSLGAPGTSSAQIREQIDLVSQQPVAR